MVCELENSMDDDGGNCNPLCDTTSGVTQRTRMGRHSLQDGCRTHHVPQRTRTLLRGSSRDPMLRPRWEPRCSPEDRSGPAPDSGSCLRCRECLSCRHYRHRVGRFGVGNVTPCQLVAAADQFVLINPRTCHRIVVENWLLIQHDVLSSNAPHFASVW